MKSHRSCMFPQSIALLLTLLCVHCRVDQHGFEIVEKQGLDMAYGLCVTESRLYVTTNDGVEIYAKRPSGKLDHVESVDIGAPCFTITVQGDLAYIGGESGITSLRLSDDRPTAIAGRCRDAGTSIHKILVRDTLLLVSDYYRGMTILATADTNTFRTVARIDLPQGATDMKTIRDILYVANLERGLLVVDVSDPAKPITIGSVESSRGARTVFISGDTLFLGTWNNGVKVYNLSDPVRPVLVDSLFQSEEVGVYNVENGLLYCNKHTRGVSVCRYDSRPPQEIARFYTGLHHDGFCEDGLLYFVGRGIFVLRLTPQS